MATKAELDAIAAAIANLTTQVSAVAASIKTSAQAIVDAHEAEDDEALAGAVKNINAQADALGALIPPVVAPVAAATPSP